MVDVVETPYGFILFMEHAILTALFICSLLIAFLLKKTMGEKWIAAGSYCFLVLWIATEGYFFHMSLRFDTTLDKFGNPDTNVSVGGFSKYFVRNFVYD